MKKTVRLTKDGWFHVRVDSADKARWKRLAKAKGLTLTAWATIRLNQVLKEQQ